MNQHAPDNYKCPFCSLAAGKNTEHNKQIDIIYKSSSATAFVSPKWWKSSPAHVIVIPNKHYENIYDIPDDELAEVYKTVKKVAMAIKTTYKSDGTSTRQHNEPGGGQDVWHFHVHVYPRYENDRLYQRHDDIEWISVDERTPHTLKLRKYLSKHEA